MLLKHAVAVCLCGLVSCLPAPKARACDLALVLAVDISGSVDHSEYRLQMDGLAGALRDGIVSEALVRARAQVLLTLWSGTSRQSVSIPWTEISSFEDIEGLARQIETAPRPWRNYATAIGEALLLSVAQFSDVPQCRRRVIDVSGDGVSNEGTDPRDLRAALSAAKVTVNAIAIEQSEAELTAYFYEHVIWGEGAFVVTALQFEDYPARIRRKLIREVAQKNAILPREVSDIWHISHQRR